MKKISKKSSSYTRKVIIALAIVMVLGIVIRFGYLKYQANRVTHGEFVQENKTFLGYTLMKKDKLYIIRCEKGVKESLGDYKAYNKRVRIISNILSSEDGLPSKEEEQEFNQFEITIVDAVVANKGNDFVLGGYVLGGGEKEEFLYAKDATKLNQVFNKLQDEFSTHTLKFDVQSDPNWSYYNAYCENRQFPS